MSTDESYDVSAAVDETAGDEPVTEQLAAPDDGGDVAGRDPDEIAREIEQTRAELADTIDAIADRISPKKAASRGAQAVKAQVVSAKDKVTGGDLNGSAPGTGTTGPATPAAAADPDVAGASPALDAVRQTPDPGPAYQVARTGPRPEIIAAAAAVVVAVAWWVRRRRSR